MKYFIKNNLFIPLVLIALVIVGFISYWSIMTFVPVTGVPVSKEEIERANLETARWFAQDCFDAIKRKQPEEMSKLEDEWIPLEDLVKVRNSLSESDFQVPFTLRYKSKTHLARLDKSGRIDLK